ncbi:non-canonical purine NTP pyrophosphatase, partial [Casaltella massiliensis]|nr:non-canonical purine NTP pyrophosphatase [Casaltella massiliensis]
PGHLLHEPHGTNGFGYDPLFVPDEPPVRTPAGAEVSQSDASQVLTSADMTAAEKNAISHRGRAIRAMVP